MGGDESEATYRDLKDELLVVVLELEGVQNGRELGGVEFHCASCLSVESNWRMGKLATARKVTWTDRRRQHQ